MNIFIVLLQRKNKQTNKHTRTYTHTHSYLYTYTLLLSTGMNGFCWFNKVCEGEGCRVKSIAWRVKTIDMYFQQSSWYVHIYMCVYIYFMSFMVLVLWYKVIYLPKQRDIWMVYISFFIAAFALFIPSPSVHSHS